MNKINALTLNDVV